MIQNSMDIIQKLKDYQFKLYRRNTMKLKDLRFSCLKCHVDFTPSEYRAKRLMKKKGVINECRICEKGNIDLQ